MFTGPCDLLCSHLILLLPYIITKGPSSGKGRSSFSEACQGLVTIAKDDQELQTELASKRNQLTEQLKHSRPRLTADQLLNEVNALISPVLVCWSDRNPPSTFDSFSILIPNGKGGIVRHNYPVESKLSLPEVVLRFVRILFGYNLSYPCSARYTWQFIERRLIDLYRFQEGPPLPRGAYQTNVAEIEKAIAEFDIQLDKMETDNEEVEEAVAEQTAGVGGVDEGVAEQTAGVREVNLSDSDESEKAPPYSPVTDVGEPSSSSSSVESSPEPVKRTRGRPPGRSQKFVGKGPRK